MTDPLHQPAADLAEIMRLADHLGEHAQQTLRGQIPGGQAMVALAPVASPEAWEWTLNSREQQRYEHQATCPLSDHRRCHLQDVSHVADELEEPPLRILLFWSEQWRTEAHALGDLRPTLISEAGWMRNNLTELHAAHRLEWPDFTADIATARRRLEDILHDGEREDRTRTPCIDCGALLVRQWADQAVHDRWVCSRKACARSYDKAGYARAQYHHLASEGAERYVPLAAACVATGRPQRTVRQWITDGRVATHRTLIGQRLVWWPDVRDCHETQPLKPRPAKEPA